MQHNAPRHRDAASDVRIQIPHPTASPVLVIVMWISMNQDAYASEAAERCTDEIAIRRLSDIDPLDDVGMVAAENSYRRGYFQGFFAALDAIQNGKTESELDRFLCDDLFSWRYGKHNGKFVQPPSST